MLGAATKFGSISSPIYTIMRDATHIMGTTHTHFCHPFNICHGRSFNHTHSFSRTFFQKGKFLNSFADTRDSWQKKITQAC